MRWNRLRAPWICLLDAFYYHSDGLEEPEVTPADESEFPSVLQAASTRINERSVLRAVRTARRRYLARAQLSDPCE